MYNNFDLIEYLETIQAYGKMIFACWLSVTSYNLSEFVRKIEKLSIYDQDQCILIYHSLILTMEVGLEHDHGSILISSIKPKYYHMRC